MALSDNPVFEETYAYYLEQIKKVSLTAVAWDLGATMESETLRVKLYGQPYQVSHDGITGPRGKKPSHEICVLLSKYILLCPQTPPVHKEWVSFKDFKDAAPLINYFAKDVEGVISKYFTGKLAALKTAAQALDGTAPDLDVHYDLALQFTGLPKVPLVLLFNDADEEFPATCALLFQRRTETYLDAECIAMLGWRLYKELKFALR